MNRRQILGGTSALLLLLASGALAGCSGAGADVSGIGTAGYSSVSFTLVDQVAWVGRDGDLVLAFSDKPFPPDLRQRMIEQKSVAFPSGHLVLELHLAGAAATLPANDEFQVVEVADAAEAGHANPKPDHGGLLATFWNFDDIPVVIEKTPQEVEGQHVVVNLTGDIREGGWATGSTRGTGISVLASGERTSFLWNIDFQVAL